MNNSIYKSINISVYDSLNTSSRHDIDRHIWKKGDLDGERDARDVFNFMDDNVWHTVRGSVRNFIWVYIDQEVDEMNNDE
jgi:hypothetical protein